MSCKCNETGDYSGCRRHGDGTEWAKRQENSAADQLDEALNHQNMNGREKILAAAVRRLQAEVDRRVGWTEDWQEEHDRAEAAEKSLAESRKALRLSEDRLNWLDWHCSFFASEPYRIGPYKEGQLRQMADDGIEQQKLLVSKALAPK
jgi:hypothetical protein